MMKQALRLGKDVNQDIQAAPWWQHVATVLGHLPVLTLCSGRAPDKSQVFCRFTDICLRLFAEETNKAALARLFILELRLESQSTQIK